jgi:hypothetical protein
VAEASDTRRGYVFRRRVGARGCETFAAAAGYGPRVRRAETTSKLLLLGSLYLAQGLPDGFFRQALPVMLRAQGLSLENIGLATLLMPCRGG